MSQANRNLIRLADYVAPDYLVDRVDMRLVLDADLTQVETVQHVRRRQDAAETTPLILQGTGLTLVAISIDDRPLGQTDYSVTDDALTLHHAPDAFHLTIMTEFSPRQNAIAIGMFTDGDNLATHMEPIGLIRLTYWQERPDVMSRFTVRLEADRGRYPILLSNGNLIAEGDLADGAHYAVWEDPIPKPSYVFSVVAGRLEKTSDTFTTASGRKVALGIYASARNHGHCAFGMAAIKRAMAWDEATFGREYDLDTFNVVALDHHATAQETKGLNILEAGLVVVDPRTATDEEFDLAERILGHEYFHNWTGNRVTCRDWFQLSLKEGLTRFRDQLFSADMSAPAVKRIHAVRILRTNQFQEDAGGGSHAVRPETYLDVSNLYTSTVYDKGAEVVRMIHAMLGAEGFSAGMDLYFERHDGEAVTVEDFLDAMSDVSGQSLDQFARWYRQPGTPVLALKQAYDSATGTLTLTVRQSIVSGAPSANPGPLHIPLRVGFVSGDASGQADIRPEVVAHVRHPVETFSWTGFTQEPLLSVNRAFSAPVKIDFERSPETLVQLIRSDSDGVNRWDSAQSLMIGAVRRAVQNLQSCRKPEDDTLVASLFGALLDDANLDPALTAEIMIFPHLGLIAEGQDAIDVDNIQRASLKLCQQIAQTNEAALRRTFAACAQTGAFSHDPLAKGQRRLRAVCLDYLLELGQPADFRTACEEACTAGSMTARSAALYSLCNHDRPERDEALQRFHDEWVDQDKVLRTWFRAQALSRLSGTAKAVAALTQHPSFNPSNSTLGMALLGGFFRQNRVAFHAADGAGYQLLGDSLLAIDPTRPQGSLWLVPELMNWRRFDVQRQAMMRAQLQRIADTPGISSGLFENVSRALAPTEGRS